MSELNLRRSERAHRVDGPVVVVVMDGVGVAAWVRQADHHARVEAAVWAMENLH